MKQRDQTIDVLKGMLVFGMVLSHVAGLISSNADFPIKHVWLLTGLVTFSGFVFSFGYACQLAYFGKDFQSSYQRMLMTALKPLIAFYISGIYWRAFVDKNLDFKGVLKILILRDIPPFSEFLVSFSLIILVSLLLFSQIQKVTANYKSFWLAFSLLLLTTFIPYSWINISQLGLIVGTDRFPTYPVLQYFSIYLAGVYFARHRIITNKRVLGISTIGFAGFIVFYLYTRQLPSRFPPSFLWITASLFLVYFYYLSARYLSKQRILSTLLSAWGKNVLFYLLMSNLIIFTFRGAYDPANLSLPISIGITLLMLLMIHFLISIVATQKQPASMPQHKTYELPASTDYVKEARVQ
ncbi:MAG: hypothetical protein IGS48_00285 [Oscillatoriales cyanobacterium C42_A2020_001]|nr:hypothetical protein [Leptolyngbyaceae cyanobacterium C42_A2020_001]